MPYLERVLKFATNVHKGQIRRGSKLPYIVHPMDVAKKVEQYFGDDDVQIAAALLHDVIEDCGVTYSELISEFGLPCADMVVSLTSDEDEINRIGKNNYLISKMIDMDDKTFEVKLCDRLSNVFDEPREKYVRNTLKMMIQLEQNRNKITSKQEIVMLKIRMVCLQFLTNLEG